MIVIGKVPFNHIDGFLIHRLCPLHGTATLSMSGYGSPSGGTSRGKAHRTLNSTF